MRSFADPRDRREVRSELLDAPVLPGSLMKTVTLVAAIEHHVVEPDTARLCRRVVTVNGQRYTCAHPDLKRPLTPAEALAYSCNDFFVSLAPRLTRAAFNGVRTRLGLPTVAADADLAASFVGLAGPRLSPRALLEMVARLAGVEQQRPVSVSSDARSVLLNGLRGAVDYGSASALQGRVARLLAKTGTAPMPQGSFMGLLVALDVAATPPRGLVVVAPGAAGADAASIAAAIFADPVAAAKGPRRTTGATMPTSSAPPSAPPSVLRPSVSASVAASAVPVDPGPRVPTTVRISIRGRTTPLELEDYVSRVLAGEGQPRAADAAQRALAITARTFAVANLGRHRREGYDLCDTTHCQVLRPATAVTRAAATGTAGQVLTHNGRPAAVFYSAHCGGHTELASQVWPGATDYVAHAHPDEACREEPGWSSEIRVADVERALRTAGARGSRLRDLRVLQRNASGRVSRVRADGFTPSDLSGHDFRMAMGREVGWQHLKSTAFEVGRTSTGYRFSGTGFGHGVGLCVIGAGHRAARGSTADAILGFYFPTLTIAQYSPARALTSNVAKPSSRTAVPGAVAPAVGAPSGESSDVLLALPAQQERDRAQVLQIVRDARDDIADRAGVPAPAALRVTVHPTVASFARTTGQPWWVSGATEGTRIEMLPLDILRQRGPLERALRHEVAHVLTDAALVGKPLWVREGAAAYFASPLESSSDVSRGSCPRDEEFLKPLSAGVHRAAYARAEACFRRALQGGRSWRDVR